MSTVAEHFFNGRQAGRVKPPSRPKALRLSEYLDAAAADLPPSTNRRASASASLKQMLCNDQLGCCVISDRGHSLGLHSAASTGTPILATDAEVKAIYRRFSPRDTGCVITQVLDYQQANGLLLGGQLRKIDGYLALDWRRQDLVKAAIHLFGALVFGIDLPRDWYESPDGATWGRTNARIVGGHDIPAVDYDEKGVTIATWGGTRLMTWDELQNGQHLDEAYVTLAPEWFNDEAVSVSGLDVATLRADLAKIGAGELPPIVSVAPALDLSGWS